MMIKLLITKVIFKYYHSKSVSIQLQSVLSTAESRNYVMLI